MTYSSKELSVAHYDHNALAMENLPYFYTWIVNVIDQFVPNRNAKICDVGCGTGALLSRLYNLGYKDLHGADFSPGCIALARQNITDADFFILDIEENVLPAKFDMLLFTTVLDFLVDPESSLENLRNSLSSDGLLIITIRNRYAYWPWYYLRHLADKLHKFPRLRHWFLWFTTPLGMRRSDQPFEKVYSSTQAIKLIEKAGFRPIANSGLMFLPMFWIPEFKGLMRFMQLIDKLARFLPGKHHFYYYMLICTAK